MRARGRARPAGAPHAAPLHTHTHAHARARAQAFNCTWPHFCNKEASHPSQARLRKAQQGRLPGLPGGAFSGWVGSAGRPGLCSCDPPPNQQRPKSGAAVTSAPARPRHCRPQPERRQPSWRSPPARAPRPRRSRRHARVPPASPAAILFPKPRAAPRRPPAIRPSLGPGGRLHNTAGTEPVERKHRRGRAAAGLGPDEVRQLPRGHGLRADEPARARAAGGGGFGLGQARSNPAFQKAAGGEWRGRSHIRRGGAAATGNAGCAVAPRGLASAPPAAAAISPTTAPTPSPAARPLGAPRLPPPLPRSHTHAHRPPVPAHSSSRSRPAPLPPPAAAPSSSACTPAAPSGMPERKGSPLFATARAVTPYAAGGGRAPVKTSEER